MEFSTYSQAADLQKDIVNAERQLNEVNKITECDRVDLFTKDRACGALRIADFTLNTKIHGDLPGKLLKFVKDELQENLNTLRNKFEAL